MSDYMTYLVKGHKCSFHPEEDAVDCYTPYGRVNDCEPPDWVYLCQKCVDESVAFAQKYDMMPSHWLKADYEIALACNLGYHCEKGVWVKNEAE